MNEFGIVRIDNFIIQAAIITSILSFSANDSVASVCSTLMYALWGIYAILLLLRKRLMIPKFAIYMICVYIFQKIFFYMMYMAGFYPSGGSGPGSYLFYCVIFFTIGFNLNTMEDRKIILDVMNAAFIGWILLMMTTVSSIDFSSYEYNTFGAKNQMSQMLGCGAMFGVYVIPRLNHRSFIKIGSALCGIGCFILCMLLHSRTPVLAFLTVSVVIFITKKNKSFKDYRIALLALIGLYVLIQILGGREFLLSLINASGTTETTLNSVSSGRITIWLGALQDFLGSPLIGIGAYAYIDNFALCVLRTGGLFSAFLLFPIAYGKTYSALKESSLQMIRSEDDISYTFALAMRCMIVFYWVVSLFEGYPPFGPGTSTFFLWIMIGVMDKAGFMRGFSSTDVSSVT